MSIQTAQNSLASVGLPPTAYLTVNTKIDDIIEAIHVITGFSTVLKQVAPNGKINWSNIAQLASYTTRLAMQYKKLETLEQDVKNLSQEDIKTLIVKLEATLPGNYLGTFTQAHLDLIVDLAANAAKTIKDSIELTQELNNLKQA